MRPQAIDFDEPPADDSPWGETDHGAHYPATSSDQLRRADEPLRIVVLDGPALARPLPELDYLVREIGMVGGAGAPHLVAGYGFSGKTLALQSLAISLAAGRPVWGAYRSPPRRVLHVDLEQGERLTRRRYQRLALATGVDLVSLGDALAVAVMPAISLVDESLDPWVRLMAGRDLLVVDSLRAATAGADENASDIRAGLDRLGQASEQTGCRALVISHSRKPTDDDKGGRYAIRGSSAIYDAADAAYVFSAEKGEPVRVEQVKARSAGELVDPWALVISDVLSESDPKAGLSVELRGAELIIERRDQRAAVARRDQGRSDVAKVRSILGRQPGLGTRELRSATGLSGDRLAAAIIELGTSVETRDEVKGRSRTTRHFLRETP
jgi:hypothetical protein